MNETYENGIRKRASYDGNVFLSDNTYCFIDNLGAIDLSVDEMKRRH